MSRKSLVVRGLFLSLTLALLAALLLVGMRGQAARAPQAPITPEFCYADQLLNKSLREDPSLQQRMEAQEETIRNYAEKFLAKREQQLTTTANYIVPVVVYIVHQNGPENITDQQVNSQIAALNKAFSGHGVQFCLATKQGNTALSGSPTPGIIRIANGATNHLTSAESPLKALSNLPGDKYLRIWVVKDIDNGSGVVGYARFPGTVAPALEGIVMRYDVFGDAATCGCSTLLPDYNQGKILAHEAGHYFNLFHPFQGGCSGVFASDCAMAGDHVCDTPQLAVANTGCPSTVFSCNGVPALLNNQMDYTNDVCRNTFTMGQDDRMLATINTTRSLLVGAQNLVYTGVQCAGGISAAFSADKYNSCTNQTITFDALNQTGATYTWDFGDGSTGSSDPLTHSYTTAGAYTVTLAVTNGSNTVSNTQQVFVTNCAPISSSQGNWFFGRFGELHFNTGLAQPGNAALTNNTINTSEACLTQSDVNGNLLFYSDGRRVWNNLHTLVNGGNLLNGGGNPAQALSVPDPADPNPANPSSFYLISLRGYTSSNNTDGNFVSTKISVSGSSVTFSAINTPIVPPTGANNSITEMVTAVPGCGSSYWIIVHGSYLDPNQTFRRALFVYPLTLAGIGAPAIYSIVGPARFGYLKASPDGSKIAYGTGDTNSDEVGGVGSNSKGYAYVLDFNRNTGVLSNPRTINRYVYGVSFSPNSQLLYLTDSVSGPTEKIFQYDLSVANLNAAEQLVAEVPETYSALQLGPDNKIYVALNGNNNHLAVINYPDQRNTGLAPNACGYSYNGPFLNIPSSVTSVASSYGLPNMIDARKASSLPADFSYTISSCSTVNFLAPACASSYAWNFGDGATSSAQNPTHSYAANGAYTATLNLNGTTTVTHTITIGLTATTIYGPSGVCLTGGGQSLSNYSANALSGLSYQWSVTGGTITGPNNNDNVDFMWNALPGAVQLTVTDPATGCVATKTLNVLLNCNPNQCITPPKGLMNWWRFDEISGTTLQDSHGFVSNNGTQVNGPTPLLAGVVNGALSFDGLDDYVEVADQAELNFLGGCSSTTEFAEPLTIDLWVKTNLAAGQTGANSGLLTLLDKRANPAQPNGYHLFLFNGQFGFQMNGTNFIAPATGSNFINIADNQWHFVAVSLRMCRGGGGFLYVDGKNVLTLPPGPGFLNTAKLNIGRRDPAFTANYFKGALDELEMFKAALSEDELRMIYEARDRGKCKVDCATKTITISPSALVQFDWTVNHPYPSATLTATGGTAPYLFAVTSGNLPPGMTLSNTGQLSGTPTQTGTYNFTVTVVDADGCRTTRNYSLVISVCLGLTNKLVSTTSDVTIDPDVTIGEGITYELTLTLPEGTIPSLTVYDTLPPGVALASSNPVTIVPNQTGFPIVPTPVVTGGLPCSAGGGGTLAINFGPITVPTDGNPNNNYFRIRLFVEVCDLPANMGMPGNQTMLGNYATVGLGSCITLSEHVELKVVEPKLSMRKSYNVTQAMEGDMVEITLAVSNGGTSPAFDVILEDPLPTALFGNITAVSTPGGFNFSTVSSPPYTVVKYTGGTILPGAALTFKFKATLKQRCIMDSFVNTAKITRAGTLPLNPIPIVASRQQRQALSQRDKNSPTAAISSEAVAGGRDESGATAIARLTIIPKGNCPCFGPPAFSNMVEWLKFEEATSIVVFDTSSKSNTGQLKPNNPTGNVPLGVPGVVSKALKFDGRDDYVEVPHNASLNPGAGGLTIDAWIRPDNLPAVFPIVDKRATVSGIPSGYFLFLANGNLNFQIGDKFPVSTVNVPTGVWTHVALVVANTGTTQTVTVSVNGAAVYTSSPAPAVNLSSSGPLWIGAAQTPIPAATNPTPNAFFLGLIDEVEIFNTALSQASIQGIVTAGKGGKCLPECLGCSGQKPQFPDVPGIADGIYSTFTSRVAIATCYANSAAEPALVAIDIKNQNSALLGVNYPTNRYHHPSWNKADLGEVFGLTLDDEGNVYVTATSVYNESTNVVFGPAGGGGIYKINALTGQSSPFVTTLPTPSGNVIGTNTLPNANPSLIGNDKSPGLGNISFDRCHQQFFVTNHEDGKIYQIDKMGQVLSTYDHGAPDNGAVGFAPLGERLWGVQFYQGRVYYSVWWEDQYRPSPTQANEIWSVALDGFGAFIPASAQLEVQLPSLNGLMSNPVSDISFSPTGRMLLAERSMSFDYGSSAHQSRVLEYAKFGNNWLPSGATFSIGVSSNTNSAGGVDYDWSAGGRVWATGDALQFNPATIYGLQGLASGGGNVTNSFLVDLDGNILQQDKTEIGDVEIPCPNLSAACPTINIDPDPETLPVGNLGKSYPPTTFTASGGSPGYTFTLAGKLPQGMNFNNGTLSGTPGESDLFPILVTATDANGCQGVRAYDLAIGCKGIGLAPDTLAMGEVGRAYPATTITATNGTVPYRLLLASGALPPGMSFSPVTGIIAGTPSQPGSFTFTVQASDAASCPGTRRYTLLVSPNLFLGEVSPKLIVAGSTATTLTVNGVNFLPGATIRWNGEPRTTTVVSSTQLTATIPAADLSTPKVVSVTVVIPGAEGGNSNAVMLLVVPPVTSVAATNYRALLASESIIAAFGTGLATSIASADSLPLPLSLAATTVRVEDSFGNERFAPLFYVSPLQVNYLLPSGLSIGGARIIITSGDGTISAGMAQLVSVAPGLFTANFDGRGVPVGNGLLVRADNTQVPVPLSQFDSAIKQYVPVPIDLGSANERVFLELYGTGFRQRSALTNVTATIGGVAATVAYAGAQGGFAGLDQINLELPRALAGLGLVDVVLTVDGQVANTVQVNIK